ncbi:isocitrate lyase/PEP mutase family protein [Ancylobacter sp. Lp-2]|uniref:isocitrate lyase/PEP mutase family protein n=1 Tax=Ancylobacter sp. Lp-2 TaxID=2881339 RepID=UPI001E57D1A4|nr:isocitrate lyase/PEP mutase family protein [Ancylobacter sp. Lp-2]MCB4771582.1 isocitrate lyase/PEP mutase family protein [Ancylobacter sp. Lp-2]
MEDTMADRHRRALRSQLARRTPIVAPGVYDCLSALVAARAGFEAVMVSGAGVAASALGVPDLGLVTFSEALNQTRAIVSAVDIPVIADCDTGYGNPLNVYRTVREFQAAGVAALFIEDQVAPKRCGHFAGKDVVPTEEMFQKIRAAVDARTDPDLILIARTDARALHGPEEALIRARAYSEAGADAIFIEAPLTRTELADNVDALAPLGIPLMANMAEGGRTPLLSIPELTELGYAIITYPGALQKTALRAMTDLMASLKLTGGLGEFYPEKMFSLDERSALLGLDRFLERGNRYADGNRDPRGEDAGAD